MAVHVLCARSLKLVERAICMPCQGWRNVGGLELSLKGLSSFNMVLSAVGVGR